MNFRIIAIDLNIHELLLNIEFQPRIVTFKYGSFKSMVIYQQTKSNCNGGIFCIFHIDMLMHLENLYQGDVEVHIIPIEFSQRALSFNGRLEKLILDDEQVDDVEFYEECELLKHKCITMPLFLSSNEIGNMENSNFSIKCSLCL